MICVYARESLVGVLDMLDPKWWIELSFVEWFLLCSGCVSFWGNYFPGKFFFFFFFSQEKLNL
jgi:hypothetical protein